MPAEPRVDAEQLRRSVRGARLLAHGAARGGPRGAGPVEPLAPPPRSAAERRVGQPVAARQHHQLHRRGATRGHPHCARIALPGGLDRQLHAASAAFGATTVAAAAAAAPLAAIIAAECTAATIAAASAAIIATGAAAECTAAAAIDATIGPAAIRTCALVAALPAARTAAVAATSIVAALAATSTAPA